MRDKDLNVEDEDEEGDKDASDEDEEGDKDANDQGKEEDDVSEEDELDEDANNKDDTCCSPSEWMTAESARAMAGEAKNSPMITRRRTRKNTCRISGL